MKIQLLFRPPENRTEDHWLKLWSRYRSRVSGATVVELYVFRLLPYTIAGCFAAYFTMALVLFVWISRKPQKDVGYWDVVVMPFDWDEFERKRGRLYIKSGNQDIRDTKYQEGVMKIRLGLKKYPEDRESRIFLAQVYYVAGLVSAAHDLLMEGIEIGMIDQDFLRAFFQLCYESDAYESMLNASNLALEDKEFSTSADNRYFINRFKVTALIELGRADEAYAIAHSINSDPDAIRRMVDAEYLALVKLGKPIDALGVLEKWRFRMDSTNVQLQSLFIDAYIELNDSKNTKRAIEELINFDRLNPDFYILAMKKWHQAENQEQLETLFTKYMLLFGWDPGNLRKVNNFVTSVREIELVEEVLRLTRKRGLGEEIILFNLFYAYLMDGRWDEASGVLDLLEASLDTFSPVDQKLVAIGETIILLKREKRDNLRLILLQELRRLRASIPFYMTVGNILTESELYEVALDTLEQGLAIFPHSKQIETAYREATQLAIQYTKDNEVIEESEILELTPDEYLTQLDQLLEKEKFDDANDLLTSIYRIGASWLEGRGEDFEYRKLQLYFETRDSFLLSQSTTLFINNNPNSGPALLDLALSYKAKGETERARILIEEIVRADPQNQAARILFRELGGDKEFTLGATQQPKRDTTSAISRSKVIADLEKSIDAKDWDVVDRQIQNTLRANPAWLSSSREAFDLLHIRYYLESNNLATAGSLIRIFMGSDAKSARELLNLAKVYDEKSMPKEKDFLTDEVRKKFPNMKL